MMECDPADLELRDGKVGIKGVPGMEKTIAEIATACALLPADLPRRTRLHQRP